MHSTAQASGITHSRRAADRFRPGKNKNGPQALAAAKERVAHGFMQARRQGVGFRQISVQRPIGQGAALGTDRRQRSNVMPCMFETFHAAFCAARSVFCSSMAMVIGPTPPGTGVIAEAISETPCIIHIADIMVFAGNTVIPGIQNNRAGLDHLARDHFGFADTRAENIGLARDLSQIRRPRMADRHGRVFLQKQQGQRLA